MSIHYHIEPLATGSHLLAVNVTIVNPSQYAVGEILTVKMPRWIPGSYKIRDYARNVINMTAYSDELVLNVNKTSSYTWQIDCRENNDLTLSYQVYAYDLPVQGAYYDHTRCFFNPCCVLVEVEDSKPHPLTLYIDLPENWEVFTALPRDDEHFEAKSYDHLIDCPIEASPNALSCEFIAGDIVHQQVFTGLKQWDDIDTASLNSHLQNIVSAQMQLFNGSPLEQEYTFMTFVAKSLYGGLEHSHSTALMASPEMLPRTNELTPMSKPVIDFFALCSHEYFHLWNIKRLKPADLLSYDLYREQHTEMLWMFEGFTSYYDELMLLRAGVINDEIFLNRQAKNLTRVMNLAGRKVMTLAESSYDAWTKLYLADENASNSLVSYYSKGAVFALYLDLWIRKNSKNEKSLDDVMRHLWVKYACADPVKGIDEVAVFAACALCVDGDKVTELENIFFTGIHSHIDLNLVEMFSAFEIKCSKRVELIAKKIASTDPQFTLKEQDNKLIVASILSESHAAYAGLSANDEIIGIDEQRHSSETANLYLKTRQPGQTVFLTVARNGQLYKLEIKLSEAQPKVWSLIKGTVSELNKKWLAKWV